MASACLPCSCALVTSFLFLTSLCAADVDSPYTASLSKNFYEESYPQAAAIVDYYVTKFLKKDKTFVGTFNRLQFHDCWIGGCDGSILLNSTATNLAEREAHVNFGPKGVEEVDKIKAALEYVCPGVVSCTLILMLAACDATHKARGLTWSVALGHRDGNVSVDLLADGNLPFLVLNFSALVANFDRKGFNAKEIVVLSSAHTIGQSHCNKILPHLYNFTGSNNATDTDPAINKKFAGFLKKLCLEGNMTNTIFLDSTAHVFDHAYYKNVLAEKGIFITDSALIIDGVGKKVVSSLSKPESTFFDEFAAGMVKMGNLGVLTGSQDEIRKTFQFMN